ncbi:MAG: LURP-one-related family protein, partial [Clostridia bacterium]
MRLVVKEKFLSISGKYYIKDREGNDVFLVKGAFSIPKKYRIYDMAGREIVMIKNTLFVPKLIAHIKFYENNKLILIAKRKFSIKAKYDINGSAGKYSINGNIFDHDFEIKQGETVIA